MNDMKYFLGREGFIWWIGVVEDRNDPEKMGRIRVRCNGWHTDNKTDIPTSALPWAMIVQPTTSPASYTPKEGDWVIGFFMDGSSAQHPAIVGVLPGKPTKKPETGKGFADPSGKYPKRINEPTTSRLARGRTDDTVIETRKRNLKKGVRSAGGVSWSEPAPAYAAQYPFNFVHESESGHVLEFDDTAGKERVHLAHKNGAFIEIDSQGNRVEKVIKDNYAIVMGSDYVYIAGKCSVTVDGDCNLKVGGKLNVEAREINMAAAGDVKIRAGGALKMEAGSGVDLKAGGAAKIGSGGKLNLTGSTACVQAAKFDVAAASVNLQGGSASTPSGTGLSLPSSGVAVGGISATSLAATGVGGTLLAQGKSLGSLTTSLNSTFTKAMGQVNLGMNQLKTVTSVGELTNSLQKVESNLNGMAGNVLNLPAIQQTTIKNGVGTLVNTASAKGIQMNITDSLLPKSATKAVEYVQGKKLFPQTDTLPKG